METRLLSGNEAVALSAYDCGVNLGCGYPGTPSSEILDEFSKLGGNAEWEPNEKCAIETAIGVAVAGCRALVTMKHVGLNVAADPLFAVAYAGTDGGLVVLTADDPGMASSQNEQDNRRYAIAAGIPLFEPSDSQECYDMLNAAFELADKYRGPVLFRMTTRVCHSKCVVRRNRERVEPRPSAGLVRDPRHNVTVPAFSRPAHRRLRADLAETRKQNETSPFNFIKRGGSDIGIVTSGIGYQHAREAAPDASILKLGLSYPQPTELIRDFCKSVKRVFVVEEGDPVLYDFVSTLGTGNVEPYDEEFRFGELNVSRVRKLLKHDISPDPVPPVAPKPPELCPGCPHRKSFEVLRDLGCFVCGDIGCYTLGLMPPYNAIHTTLCMGASITMALGLRKMLPEEQARQVVSVIGDSTFFHTGINGAVEMVYNRPKTGHLLIILDNRTTAMTGLQENPGTGKCIDHVTEATEVSLENVLRGIGFDYVESVDSTTETERFADMVRECLAATRISAIIVRRQCVLAAVRNSKMKKN
ncbi:MAG: thiamine pyrophosphate-dependent enzyme [Victivallaceae bacterium]|nr:thiamine pyrophosphate-dependent enzyme [Victivallaceae bacterium]